MSYEEQIMSKGKYTSIFLRQTEAILCLLLCLFSFLKYLRFRDTDVLHYANEESDDVVGGSN